MVLTWTQRIFRWLRGTVKPERKLTFSFVTISDDVHSVSGGESAPPKQRIQEPSTSINSSDEAEEGDDASSWTSKSFEIIPATDNNCLLVTSSSQVTLGEDVVLQVKAHEDKGVQEGRKGDVDVVETDEEDEDDEEWAKESENANEFIDDSYSDIMPLIGNVRPSSAQKRSSEYSFHASVLAPDADGFYWDEPFNYSVLSEATVMSAQRLHNRSLRSATAAAQQQSSTALSRAMLTPTLAVATTTTTESAAAACTDSPTCAANLLGEKSIGGLLNTAFLAKSHSHLLAHHGRSRDRATLACSPLSASSLPRSMDNTPSFKPDEMEPSARLAAKYAHARAHYYCLGVCDYSDSN